MDTHILRFLTQDSFQETTGFVGFALCKEYLQSAIDSGFLTKKKGMLSSQGIRRKDERSIIASMSVYPSIMSRFFWYLTVLYVRYQKFIGIYLDPMRIRSCVFTLSCISHPKITLRISGNSRGGNLQKPNPDRAADMNLSFAITLPLITPSASIPATLTLISSRNSASSSSTVTILVMMKP